MQPTCFTKGIYFLIAATLAFAPILEARETQREPVLLKSVNPIYPSGFSKSKVETTVDLLIVIDEKGNVVEANVLRAVHESFGNAALGAVRQWKFKPAMKNGKLIKARRIQPIFFSFSGRKPPGKSINLSRYKKSGRTKNIVYPEILSHRVPVYPFDLLAEGVNGSATVNFVVGKGGSVVNTEIQEQSHPEFGFAAVSALMHWKFKPVEKSGQLIPFALKQEFTFNRYYITPVIRDWVRKIKKGKADFIIKPKELDKVPKPTVRKNPVFPLELESKGIEGKVKIRFLVDSQGKVQLPRVEEATDPLFGYSAVAAISDWNFEPPRRKGEPVVTEFVMPMTFKLPNQ